MVEPPARFEEIKIPLLEPVHGLDSISGVVGIPEWWPTGARIAVAIGHGSASDMNDPLIEELHRDLTGRKYLTLRFNFPFAEAGKRSSADSPKVLELAYRAALSTLGRDPTAAPAHLFLGGKGLGARVAAQISKARVRIDGAFFLGFPLHRLNKVDTAEADELYRIISPMLFVQGTRDRMCDLEALRTVLARVGAPTTLRVIDEADQNFKVLRKSNRTNEEIRSETLAALAGWIENIAGGS